MGAPGASPLGTWDSTDLGLEKLKSLIPQRLLPECRPAFADFYSLNWSKPVPIAFGEQVDFAERESSSVTHDPGNWCGAGAIPTQVAIARLLDRSPNVFRFREQLPSFVRVRTFIFSVRLEHKSLILHT